MPKKIVIIQANPDPSPERYGRQLEAAYTDAARKAGHEVVALDLARMTIPFLASKTDYDKGKAPKDIAAAQRSIAAAAEGFS